VSESIRIGDWVLDPETGTLSDGDKEHRVPETHLRVLMALIANSGRPVETPDLLERGWQSSRVSEDNLSVAISHLRAAFADDPQNPTVIRTVPGRGYELLAPVAVERAEGLAQNRLVRSVLAVLLGLAVLATWWNLRETEPADPITMKVVEKMAVLPLESATADQAWLASALTRFLVSELETWQELETRAHGSVLAVTPQPAVAASALGVDAVVTGTVASHRGETEITLELSDGEGSPLWSQTLGGDAESLHLILRELLGNLRSVVAWEKRPYRDLAPDSLSFETMLLAGNALEAGNGDQATELARGLIEQYPDYLPGYLTLIRALHGAHVGDPLAVEAVMPEIEKLLTQVLSIDPESAEAHLLRGTIYFNELWDFDAAEESLREAARLAPGRAACHYQLARFTACFSDFDESLDHLDRLVALDPLGYSKLFAAWVYNMTRRYEDALAQLALAELEMPPGSELDGAYLRTYEYMGEDARAFARYMAIFERADAHFTEADLTRAESLFREEGLEGLYRWLIYDHFVEEDIGQYDPPLAVARYCAAAGEKEYVYYWLEKARDIRQTELLFIEVDPKYDTLRSDPRFKDLRDRIFAP